MNVVDEIRARLEARKALSEYDLIPVRELLDGLAGGNVDAYARLMESVREVAHRVSEDADIASLLEEVRLRSQRIAALEIALRDTDTQLEEWTRGVGPIGGPLAVRDLRKMNALLLKPETAEDVASRG